MYKTVFQEPGPVMAGAATSRPGFGFGVWCLSSGVQIQGVRGFRVWGEGSGIQD